MVPIITEIQAITFLLVLARISGIFLASPILSSRYLTAKLKIALSVVISIMLFQAVAPVEAIPTSMLKLAWVGTQQVLFGFFIGSCVACIFAGIQAGGEFIDNQIGFTLSAEVDPVTNVRAPLTSQLYNFMAIMIFFAINGHHWLFLGLINSFRTVPLDSFVLTPGATEFFIRSFSDIMVFAFHVAAPVFVAVFLINVIMAVIGKIAPQMNILILGFPFKIYMGIFLLIATLPFTMSLLQRYLETMQEPLLKMFMM